MDKRGGRKGRLGSKVSASKRDVIQQLKEEAANGEFDILLVYMFDRLGRIESETPFGAGMVRPAWYRNVEYPRRSAENRDTWR